jgi:hypothetical protein
MINMGIPTLMTCARRICSIVNIDPNEICEIYFVDRKAIHQDYYIRGIVLKTKEFIIITPSIDNCEYVLMYNILKYSIEDIVDDLVHIHEFAQRDVAIFLRYSQAMISRYINKREGLKDPKEGVKNEKRNVGDESHRRSGGGYSFFGTGEDQGSTEEAE